MKGKYIWTYAVWKCMIPWTPTMRQINKIFYTLVLCKFVEKISYLENKLGDTFPEHFLRDCSCHFFSHQRMGMLTHASVISHYTSAELAASQDILTHFDETSIYPLLHTWAPRLRLLASAVVIDRGVNMPFLWGRDHSQFSSLRDYGESFSLRTPTGLYLILSSVYYGA